MNGSSDDDVLDVLGKVDTKQVRRFLAVLVASDSRSVSFVERRYRDDASNFAETLRFLSALSWISESQGVLTLTEAGLSACRLIDEDERIRDAIADAVTKASPYRRFIAQYLCRFSVRDGQATYQPSLSERARERPVRDLLMDLRLVSYVQPVDLYLLESRAAPLYVWSQNFGRTKDSAVLRRSQQRREELGFAAEVAVLHYERLRVGKDLARYVEHVADDQPFANYDIKSVTVTSKDLLDRFVEVKAVPMDSLRFYWSRSEIDAAQMLRDRYYLYLLPYAVTKGFDVSALVMVCDPYQTVYKDRNAWEVEEDVILCRKRPEESASVSSAD